MRLTDHRIEKRYKRALALAFLSSFIFDALEYKENRFCTKENIFYEGIHCSHKKCLLFNAVNKCGHDVFYFCPRRMIDLLHRAYRRKYHC
jgi:hypothetical protein